jgi:hypothetical protein
LIAERTNPAVQLIRTSHTATLSARPTDYSSAGIDLLELGLAKLSIGELQSPSDVIAYVFERIEQNPTYYLREFWRTENEDAARCWWGFRLRCGSKRICRDGETCGYIGC